MSYDLMVFDPEAPPQDRAGFVEWYLQQIEWGEGHSYDDPKVSTSALSAWFFDMTQEYPAMNGPYASDDVDDPKVTDYCIGRAVIYTAFAWSEAESAYHAVFEAARKHRVGFYDVSADDGQVWMPTSSGEYVCVHGGG
jgi:hypothetical protein